MAVNEIIEINVGFLTAFDTGLHIWYILCTYSTPKMDVRHTHHRVYFSTRALVDLFPADPTLSADPSFSALRSLSDMY